jgi:hypothetical protein
MLIFVVMIGLEALIRATYWTAVAAVILLVFVYGYSWIGVPWLYGPEVSIRPSVPSLFFISRTLDRG